MGIMRWMACGTGLRRGTGKAEAAANSPQNATEWTAGEREGCGTRKVEADGEAGGVHYDRTRAATSPEGARSCRNTT